MLVTPDKPKETGVSNVDQPKQSNPAPSCSSGMNLPVSHIISDPLDNYEFAEVKKSKFFATNDSESESDCSVDSHESEAEKWQHNFKKRKQNVKTATLVKKQDRKTTPQNKK